MAMQYDGKTYRNLQEQVAYLTAKWQQLADEIEEVRAQIPSKMIVEELPEEGDPLITYYVGPKGTEPNLYYEVWVWVQEEPDGPFVWRELEDTDQVDLSGYLEKDTTASTYPKVYVKWGDGTQGLENLTQDNTFNAVVRRKADGRITVPSPAADGDCTNKKYVDDGFVAKRTGTSAQPEVYVKGTDGTQSSIAASVNSEALTIVRRTSTNQVRVAGTPDGNGDATSKQYVDTNFLAKQTAATTYSQVYTKSAGGVQGMTSIAQGSVDGFIPVRTTGGNIIVPATPTDNNHAASKAYVDAAVGQLLYLHDIEIIVTVDATNKLYIKAYLINGSSTAITAIDRAIFKRMDVQYGAFGPNIANVTTCAVTKCPDALRQDEFDEPYPAYLYQYMSGGSLVSGATTYAMSVTVTDSVITF